MIIDNIKSLSIVQLVCVCAYQHMKLDSYKAETIKAQEQAQTERALERQNATVTVHNVEEQQKSSITPQKSTQRDESTVKRIEVQQTSQSQSMSVLGVFTNGEVKSIIDTDIYNRINTKWIQKIYLSLLPQVCAVE